MLVSPIQITAMNNQKINRQDPSFKGFIRLQDFRIMDASLFKSFERANWSLRMRVENDITKNNVCKNVGETIEVTCKAQQEVLPLTKAIIAWGRKATDDILDLSNVSKGLDHIKVIKNDFKFPE